MSLQTTPREQRRLLEVAREYRQRGYKVIIEPHAEQLPAFLASFHIDMLARNAEENVIVEVRTQDSLTGIPKLDAIAQALHDKPSWRFELVVTNPKDRSAISFKDAVSLEHSDVLYRLAEARQLLSQEHGEAALLLAWSATEALLRSIAANENIRVEQANPRLLIKSLFTGGVLDSEQYQTFQQALQARNMIVHGYKEQHSSASSLEMMLSIADQLIQRYTSVKYT
jgi:hypothetical protein